MKYQLVISVILKWELVDNTNYKWSECKKLINTKTGRQIKKVINGGSVGYWIGDKFLPLSVLKTKIKLIKPPKTPF